MRAFICSGWAAEPDQDGRVKASTSNSFGERREDRPNSYCYVEIVTVMGRFVVHEAANGALLITHGDSKPLCGLKTRGVDGALSVEPMAAAP